MSLKLGEGPGEAGRSSFYTNRISIGLKLKDGPFFNRTEFILFVIHKKTYRLVPQY